MYMEYSEIADVIFDAQRLEPDNLGILPLASVFAIQCTPAAHLLETGNVWSASLALWQGMRTSERSRWRDSPLWELGVEVSVPVCRLAVESPLLEPLHLLASAMTRCCHPCTASCTFNATRE
jgi:hypothetical protein